MAPFFARLAMLLLVVSVAGSVYESLVPPGIISGFGLVLWMIFIVVLLELAFRAGRKQGESQ